MCIRDRLGFAHPQEVRGMLGMTTPLAEQYLQVKINGDMALLKGMQKALLAAEAEAPGTVLDQEFIDQHTTGFAKWRTALRR